MATAERIAVNGVAEEAAVNADARAAEDEATMEDVAERWHGRSAEAGSKARTRDVTRTICFPCLVH